MSNVGGLRELIPDDNCGITFKAGNLDDLSDKLFELSKFPEKKISIGKKARHAMKYKRDWEKIVKMYIDVYE